MNIGAITKTNGFKVSALIFLILLFLIPVGMVREIIRSLPEQ
jgi:inner membrane protein involved in colicin E2 resistance